MKASPRLTVREAASMAGVDVVTVYGWIHDGRLALSRVPRRRRSVPRCIPLDALAALLAPIDPQATLL